MKLKVLLTKIKSTKGRSLPTAAMLKKDDNMVVASIDLELDTKLSVYDNGFALYETDYASTVFRVDECKDYTYYYFDHESKYDFEYFLEKEWWIRLVLEGEDRIKHNNDKQQDTRKSYFDTSDEIVDPMNLDDYVLNLLTLEKAYSMLTNRQKEVLQLYYIQGYSEKEIAHLYGNSQQAISLTRKSAIKKLILNQDLFK